MSHLIRYVLHPYYRLVSYPYYRLVSYSLLLSRLSLVYTFLLCSAFAYPI